MVGNEFSWCSVLGAAFDGARQGSVALGEASGQRAGYFSSELFGLDELLAVSCHFVSTILFLWLSKINTPTTCTGKSGRTRIKNAGKRAAHSQFSEWGKNKLGLQLGRKRKNAEKLRNGNEYDEYDQDGLYKITSIFRRCSGRSLSLFGAKTNFWSLPRRCI